MRISCHARRDPHCWAKEGNREGRFDRRQEAGLPRHCRSRQQRTCGRRETPRYVGSKAAAETGREILLGNVPSNSLLVSAAEVARTILIGFVCQQGVSVYWLAKQEGEKVDRYEWQPSRKNEVKKRLMRCQTCWTTPHEGAERNEAIFRSPSPGNRCSDPVHKIHKFPGALLSFWVSNFRTICFPTSVRRTPEFPRCSP
jgi:hypothetical protein